MKIYGGQESLKPSSIVVLVVTTSCTCCSRCTTIAPPLTTINLCVVQLDQLID
eukprot:m.90479 g.90479  ORF g.90479 m.90479 type:complete len:53 (-) comp20129_c0_seq3:2850-3008(-)